MALLCAHIMVKNVFVIPKSSLGSFAICFFFHPLYPFFLTPLSHCVALYHGAGSGPCSLDPFCLHGQLPYPPHPTHHPPPTSTYPSPPPPRSHTASGGTAQRRGLENPPKQDEQDGCIARLTLAVYMWSPSPLSRGEPKRSASLCWFPPPLTRSLAEGLGVPYPRERSRQRKGGRGQGVDGGVKISTLIVAVAVRTR